MINRDHPVYDAARVAPRLWIGSHPPHAGHHCEDHRPYPYDLKRDGSFDFLALCAAEYQPHTRHFPGVQVHHAPFDDDPAGLDAKSREVAAQAVRATVEAHRRGANCLVTCWAGRNRSGLVLALALAELAGIPPAQAGQIVRDKRGIAALTNGAFRGILAQAPGPLAGRGSGCELCVAEPITRRYHEDPICWVADCKQCRVPMAVYRVHGVRPTPEHLAHMHGLLARLAPGCRFDDSMNTIPDHYHVHARTQ